MCVCVHGRWNCWNKIEIVEEKLVVHFIRNHKQNEMELKRTFIRRVDLICNALHSAHWLLLLPINVFHYTNTRNHTICRWERTASTQFKIQELKKSRCSGTGRVRLCVRMLNDVDVDVNRNVENVENGKQKEKRLRERESRVLRCGFYVFLILSVGFSRRAHR